METNNIGIQIGAFFNSIQSSHEGNSKGSPLGNARAEGTVCKNALVWKDQTLRTSQGAALACSVNGAMFGCGQMTLLENSGF